MTEPNMTRQDMLDWRDMDAFSEYRQYHQENVYGEGKADSTVMRVSQRALAVIKHGRNSKHYDKVTGYLARAVPQYKEHGMGSRTFGQNPEVAKNECALLCWGYCPNRQKLRREFQTQ